MCMLCTIDTSTALLAVGLAPLFSRPDYLDLAVSQDVLQMIKIWEVLASQFLLQSSPDRTTREQDFCFHELRCAGKQVSHKL